MTLPGAGVDVFRTLCGGGVHFKNRDVAREKKRDVKVVSAQRVPLEVADADGELDFFGTSRAPSSVNPNGRGATTPVADAGLKKVRRPFKTDVDVEAYRAKKEIRVWGEDVPHPVRTFAQLVAFHGADPRVISAVEAAGVSKPTAVQMQATTLLLSGQDALVTAPTGSGKTLVFVISLLSSLLRDPSAGGIRALVVSPTRELAAQIREQFRRFCPVDAATGRPLVAAGLLNKATLNSWAARRPKCMPAILVSTPRRLIAGIEQGVLVLSSVAHLVLDEGDRLLDEGMLGQMDTILVACNAQSKEDCVAMATGHESESIGDALAEPSAKRLKCDATVPATSIREMQRVLLSATIPSGIEALAASFMRTDPAKVSVGGQNAAAQRIKQRLVYVGHEEGRAMALQQMIVQGIDPPVIVFTETAERAMFVHGLLAGRGLRADVIHGGRSQQEREDVVARFRRGQIWFLVTTDLLARGLDFPDVRLVVNYDFPQSTASYIHRIGRTGRAGRRGEAITLFARTDAPMLRMVANVMRASGCDVPLWMMDLPDGRREIKRQARLRRRRMHASADTA